MLADTENSWQPETINAKGEAPTGKLDLIVSVDFRMTSSGLFSDIILPAATWYEKFDISSTDLHPFVHPFNAADRKSTRLNSSHVAISYAVFCLKKKKK